MHLLHRLTVVMDDTIVGVLNEMAHPLLTLNSNILSTSTTGSSLYSIASSVAAQMTLERMAVSVCLLGCV